MNGISSIFTVASECNSLYGVLGILIVCASVVTCVVVIAKLISKYDNIQASSKKNEKKIEMIKQSKTD